MKPSNRVASSMTDLEAEKARGEARSERRQHRGALKTARERTLQDEQHGRRRHVAVVAQGGSLVDQRPAVEPERRFDPGEDFCAARMADEAGSAVAEFRRAGELAGRRREP